MLSAWIIEKFRTWSDCNGDIESVHTRDDLLTNIMIYWIAQNIGSSMRFYYENSGTMPGTDKANGEVMGKYVEVPTGVIWFPKEIYRTPRPIMEFSHNIVHWTKESAGGHFAAMEKPEALVRDIRKFFLEVAPGAQRKPEPTGL